MNDGFWVVKWVVGSGSVAKVAGEHLRWGFLEKFWLQGCKFWGISAILYSQVSMVIR